MWVNTLYYFMKPAIPRPVQLTIRQHVAARKIKKYADIWPIDSVAAKKPTGWPGWPSGKKFALVLTHDVDTACGQENCIELKELEESLGFKSSFNFVPERYKVSTEILSSLRASGFEIGVHGLNHDGKLYSSKRTFSKRAIRINDYLCEWGAVGFRSPSMHHCLDWLHELNIEYDSSTFDTDPFEPQADGVRTIFPFWLTGAQGRKILEIPYTLPQDFSLFILFKYKTIAIWEEKLAWIAQNGGAAVLNVHPDYIRFNDSGNNGGTYASSLYSDFLKHIARNYQNQYWLALPKELTAYCAQHFTCDSC